MSISQYTVLPKAWLGASSLLLLCLSFGVSSAPPPKGWYIGAKTGLIHATGGCESHATDCDKQTAGGELFTGYMLNTWLSVEGSYGHFGEVKAIYPALGHPTQAAFYKGELQGFTLSIKPYWQFNDEWSVFGKVGGIRWNMDVTGSEVGFVHDASDSGWSPVLGAGVEYAFNRQWSAAMEYLWANNVGGHQTGGTDLSVLNLGITYHFGSLGFFR
ncbi:MAG: outer membrane beta-barrel protein [Plesiomonas sp.]|uniref:outer membrane beta-barrel protein n=1 Tax=Plesiomonas sp. TaxID=2486279 RepID=UPI003F402C02